MSISMGSGSGVDGVGWRGLTGVGASEWTVRNEKAGGVTMGKGIGSMKKGDGAWGTRRNLVRRITGSALGRRRFFGVLTMEVVPV